MPWATEKPMILGELITCLVGNVIFYLTEVKKKLQFLAIQPNIPLKPNSNHSTLSFEIVQFGFWQKSNSAITLK